MKSIKTIVASSAAVILGFALVASAATFSNYMSVGSTGANVVQLQNWLIANNFSIPAITSGVASPGYYGSQTQAAVRAYQTSVGIPSLGMVGPLTLAALNRGSVASGSGTLSISQYVASCPAGFTCPAPVAIGGAVPGCPAGQICTPIGGASISTPGVVGTLAVSLWSSPSGIVAYKGQSYDVASYKIQASASDMALQNLSLDFDVRLWLYASSVTVKDDTGAVIGQVNNLNQGNFSELTVGSQYRLSVPVSNYVVRATQIKYLTVNVTLLPTSDRSTGNVDITEVQIRSVDGTGVTDTQSVGTGTTVGKTSGTDYRSFSYQGSGAGSIIVTTDSSSPATGLVQLSTSVQTQDVPLAVFDVKSQNAPSTLRSISFIVRTAGTTKTVADLFGTFKIRVGGQTYSANSITANASTGLAASSTVAFTSLTIPLAADTYLPITVLANVNVDTSNALDGTSASTTLAAAGTAGLTTNNPSVEDSSYNTLAVNTATFTSNALTFTGSGLNASGLAVSYGTLPAVSGTIAQKVFYNFSLTAGNNPIYVSAVQGTALTTSANPTGLTMTSSSLTDTDTSGDSSGVYFYLSPGQTKVFSAIYTASGLNSAAGGNFSIDAINFGTSTTALTAGALTSSALINGLTANLWH
jgi:peptidoglycan hydrolase-like protein with peptidoglycan-binding domain